MALESWGSWFCFFADCRLAQRLLLVDFLKDSRGVHGCWGLASPRTPATYCLSCGLLPHPGGSRPPRWPPAHPRPRLQPTSTSPPRLPPSSRCSWGPRGRLLGPTQPQVLALSPAHPRRRPAIFSDTIVASWWQV